MLTCPPYVSRLPQALNIDKQNPGRILERRQCQMDLAPMIVYSNHHLHSMSEKCGDAYQPSSPEVERYRPLIGHHTNSPT